MCLKEDNSNKSQTEHIESTAMYIHTQTLKNAVLFEVIQLPSILLNKYHVQELSQIISHLLN